MATKFVLFYFIWIDSNQAEQTIANHVHWLQRDGGLLAALAADNVSLLANKFVLFYFIEITSNQTNCKYQHKWFLSYFTSGRHARTITQLGDDVLVWCGMMMSWDLWPTHLFVFQRVTERDNGSSMVCKAAVSLVSPRLLLWVGGVFEGRSCAEIPKLSTGRSLNSCVDWGCGKILIWLI